VCVCVCVYVYIYIYVCIYICIYIYYIILPPCTAQLRRVKKEREEARAEETIKVELRVYVYTVWVCVYI